MHVEPPRGLGDVTVAHLVDALDVFPAHPIRRHRIVRQLGLLGAAGKQSRNDIVGVGRLRKIVHRAHLHGGDGGGDISITRPHQPPRRPPPAPPPPPHRQAPSPPQPPNPHRKHPPPPSPPRQA